jgi:hypothetical protein
MSLHPNCSHIWALRMSLPSSKWPLREPWSCDAASPFSTWNSVHRFRYGIWLQRLLLSLIIYIDMCIVSKLAGILRRSDQPRSSICNLPLLIGTMSIFDIHHWGLSIKSKCPRVHYCLAWMGEHALSLMVLFAIVAIVLSIEHSIITPRNRLY